MKPPTITIAVEPTGPAEPVCTLALDGTIAAERVPFAIALWTLWQTCLSRSADWTEAQRHHVADGLVEITHRLYTFGPGEEFTADWDWDVDDARERRG